MPHLSSRYCLRFSNQHADDSMQFEKHNGIPPAVRFYPDNYYGFYKDKTAFRPRMVLSVGKTYSQWDWQQFLITNSPVVVIVK